MQGDSRSDRATTEDHTAAPAAHPRLRGLGAVLLVAHLALLAWLSLRPVAVGWTYPANLTPFASVGQALRLGGLAGLQQLAAGLLPLTPLGLLLPLVGGRLRTPWLPSFLRTVGGAALVATALEILEGQTPGHVLNVDDIMLGTIGVALCHAALVPLARALLLRHTTRAPRLPRATTPAPIPIPAPRPTHRPAATVRTSLLPTPADQPTR
ncbi:VanZ family protein [Kitasatospora sp. MMS16-BH015]|uniref:VanZ family protein n=1 Tax=Kitasatospora sp. MMS16-BH015 TaxID=2018025 RepID=UPI000CA0D6A0|nr:VanZ family protein [Kitasatospora sp. MMS16-BH015]AUG77629.1 VanZ family protein [Kitasatospora sp. MMS16-BH015]